MSSKDTVKARFDQEVVEHQMTVLLANGLHRHLRFRQPGTEIYGFDLVTWPGYLTICGDCGTYVFARMNDMFAFFEQSHGSINLHYWAEKLQAPRGRDGVLSFSEDRYRELVEDWLSKQDFNNAARDMAREALLGNVVNEVEAREGLETWVDAYDWDFRDYDAQFIRCCYAIVWGIEKYRDSDRSHMGH
jgi:hypothetical protein